MRKVSVVVALVGMALAGSLASAPAQAQTVNFSLTGGSLSIAEPGTASLAGGSLLSLAGASMTGSLGSTTVTDQRGGVLGWTTTIAQTAAFSNGTTTIPVGNTVAWVPGVILPSSGVATVTTLYGTQLTGLTLSGTGQNFVTATAVVGNNTTSFSPSIAVSIPSNATAGSYSGTVTQTVA